MESTPNEAVSYEEDAVVAPLSQQALQQGDEEGAYLEKVCRSFQQYATFLRTARLDRTRRAVAAGIPSASDPSLNHEWQRAEVRNQFFLDAVLRHAEMATSQDVIALQQQRWSTDEDIAKVGSVFKSLYRDWSVEGREERDAAYQPIVAAIQRHLPLPHNALDGDEEQRHPQRRRLGRPRVVVPGAGLGRLALEIYRRGYEVQGNEFSMHMLLVSDFILNRGLSPGAISISPWLAETRNVRQRTDPMRTIDIPDIDPMSAMASAGSATTEGGQAGDEPSPLPPPDFSMAAGDFVGIYNNVKEHGQWDAVASCFFLDTAPCVMDYIRVMYNMLREGGLVVNLGPLLHHWSGPPRRPDDTSVAAYQARHASLDRRYLDSVDVTWQDVRELLVATGFDILQEELDWQTWYTADPQSLMNTQYNCVFFVAQKRRRQSQAATTTTTA